MIERLPVNSAHGEVVTWRTRHIENSSQRLPQKQRTRYTVNLSQWTRHRGCLISRAWSQSNFRRPVMQGYSFFESLNRGDITRHNHKPNNLTSATWIWWTILTCAQKLTCSQLSLPHGKRRFVLPANKPFLPLLPSRRASLPFGWYSFYHPMQGRRLSRPTELKCCPQELNPDLVGWGGGHPIPTLHRPPPRHLHPGAFGARYPVPSVWITATCFYGRYHCSVAEANQWPACHQGCHIRLVWQAKIFAPMTVGGVENTRQFTPLYTIVILL